MRDGWTWMGILEEIGQRGTGHHKFMQRKRKHALLRYLGLSSVDQPG